MSPRLAERLRGLLNEGEALELLRGAISCDSVTGSEATFATYLGDELLKLGAQSVTLRDFAPGRPNVWGVRQGRGRGPTLMIVGHTDTVHVDGWGEQWQGTERENPFGGAVVNGEIWGRGAGDLKAGICAALAAAALLNQANISLAGDLVFAFVGDEESGEPDSGVSAGIKALLPVITSGELPRADFALYVEPTQLAVYSAQMGFFIADIYVEGVSAYFGVPELGKDALKAGHAVLSALWTYSETLGQRAQHPLVGRAFLVVTEVAAGGYIAVPGACKISLIRKLLPQENLGGAVRELEGVVGQAVANLEGITVITRYPAGRDHVFGGTPTEVVADHPAVQKLRAAAQQVMPGGGEIMGAPYWSEAPFLIDALGVPTVYFAPGDIRNCHTHFERVSLNEYFSGIVALAVFIADYCGVIQP